MSAGSIQSLFLILRAIVGLFEKIKKFFGNSFLRDLIVQSSQLISDPLLTYFTGAVVVRSALRLVVHRHMTRFFAHKSPVGYMNTCKARQNAKFHPLQTFFLLGCNFWNEHKLYCQYNMRGLA